MKRLKLFFLALGIMTVIKKHQRSIAIAIVLTLGFAAMSWAYKQKPKQTTPKEKNYILKESTINQVRAGIGGVYDYIDKSNLPQQEAKNIKTVLANIDAAIQKDISDSTLNKK